MGTTMVDRRILLKGGLGLAAALFGAPRSGGAERAVEPRAAPDVVLVDRHLRGSAAFIAAAHGRGLKSTLLEFTSDVARAWMLEIEPRLRSGPLVIEGYTSGATLFCIEFLARDYGARLARRNDAAAGVEWIVSSTRMQRAALAPLEFRRSTPHA
jgi:hypothetical protein